MEGPILAATLPPPEAVDDVWTGTALPDTYNGHLGNDRLSGLGGNDFLVGGGGDDVLRGGSGADYLKEFDELVFPTAGNDIYDGGIGSDLLHYGGERALIIDLSLDGIAQNTGGGGTDTLISIEGVITGDGNDIVRGSAAANYIETGFGTDRIEARDGNDSILVSNGTKWIDGGAGNDTLAFQPLDTTQSGLVLSLGRDGVVQNTVLGAMTLRSIENLGGTSFDDTLTGNAADNILAGGYGSDTLLGGGGNDTLAGDGDLAWPDLALSQFSNFSFVLNPALSLDRTGDDMLEGGKGDDTLNGGRGSDTASYAHASGAVHADLALKTSSGADGVDRYVSIENLIGSGFSDDLVGNAGANRIDGGAGADTMTGGAGDDTYVVSGPGDVIVELAGGGVDTVETAISYTLADNLEQVVLTGSAAINATGNAGANRLTGNAGINTLKGLGGNDVYVISALADHVMEAAGGGHDRIEASISYALPRYVEDMTLVGTGAIDGTGNAQANIIIGNGAANVIDGGAGADIMRGGAGADTYVVDNIGDRVIEGVDYDLSIDTVRESLADYVIPAFVETVVMLDGAINLTLSNASGQEMTVVGNAADNVIDDGHGVGLMSGGAGNDTYILHNDFDQIFENPDEGVDTVQVTSSTIVLADNVENAVLNGPECRFTGNDLGNHVTSDANGAVIYALGGNDTIIGGTGVDTIDAGAGNDVIDGGTGADSMAGGTGDDTYYVDSLFDTVSEAYNAGTDTVYASRNCALWGNVEILYLTGSATQGTGNWLANQIFGNDLANTLDGGMGADTLAGGTGDDIYYVDQAGDSVVEATDEGTDTVVSMASRILDANVENLTLSSNTSPDLRLALGNGLDNTVTGSDFADMLDGAGGVDTLVGGDGDDLLVAGVEGDSLTGGVGTDRFAVVGDDPGTTAAIITDFTGGKDQIVIVTNTLSGTLAPDAFALGTEAADASDRVIFDSASGQVWFDADGAGGEAQVLIATVDAGTTLAAGDIAFMTRADVQAQVDALLLV